MKISLLKSVAVAIACLLVQACTDETLAPRQPEAGKVSAAKDLKQNERTSFSARIRPYSLEFPYAELTFEGAEIGKTITINWGDGTIENYTFTEGYNGRSRVWMEHYYTSLDEVLITVTGDLDNIVAVISPLTTVEIYDINFDKLTNLEEVHMPYNSMETLDVSKNRKLNTFYGPSSTLTKNIILPNTHELRFVATGSPNLPTKVVSDMIATVYRNAVRNQIYNGEFELASIMSEDPTFPGPPTEDDMAKLIELRDVYGWRIFPNP